MSVLASLLLALPGAGPIQVSVPETPGCPRGERVARDIEVLMGSPPAAPLDVLIEIRNEVDGVVAELAYTVREQWRTRSIPGPDCATVVNAAAVVVAVDVEPLGVARSVKAEPSLQRPQDPGFRTPAVLQVNDVEVGPEPVAEPQTAPSRTTVSQRSPPTRPDRRLRISAFARGGATVGALPRTWGWVGGGLGFGVRSLGVEVFGQHQFAQRIGHAEAPRSGADVSLSSGGVAGCWLPRRGAFTAGLCISGEAGAATAGGEGLVRKRETTRAWAAVGPGVRALWTPGNGLRLGVALDVPISLVQPVFIIDDFEAPLARVGAMAVRVGLSIGFTFFDESRPSRR